MAFDIVHLHCLSFNTKAGLSAPLREAVSLKPFELLNLSDLLQLSDSGKGLFYLGTCHRIEVYSYGIEPEDLKTAWAQIKGSSVFEGESFVGQNALEHLYRVTSSVESEVLGETQITGQVKDAAQACREQALLSGPLDRLIQNALRVAKRVRSETDLGKGTVSVAHVAVDGLKDMFDSFEDKSALVIGAGSMAQQALERLLKLGVGKITWINRSRHKLFDHPLSRQCQIGDYENRYRLCWQHDISVVATSSPTWVLDLNSLEAERVSKKSQAVESHLILDLGLPRNVDDKIHGFREFYLRNVDEFRDHADANTQARHKAKGAALEIITAELKSSLKDIEGWERGPLVGELKEKLALIFAEELNHLKLESSAEMVYISRTVQGKLLHKILKEIENYEAQEALEILRFLNRAWRPADSWLQKQNLEPKLPQKLLQLSPKLP